MAWWPRATLLPLLGAGLCCLLVTQVLGQDVNVNCSLQASPTTGSAGSVIELRRMSNCSFSFSGVINASVHVPGAGYSQPLVATVINNTTVSITLLPTSFRILQVANVRIRVNEANSNTTVLFSGVLRILPDLNVTSALPVSGQVGTLLTLFGCFPPSCGDSNISAVFFENFNLRAYLRVISNVSISFVIPTNVVNTSLPNTVTFTITTPSSASLNYTWTLAPRIQIFRVTPSIGQTGTRVSILGQNLFGLGGQNGTTPLPTSNLSVMLDNRPVAIDTSASNASRLVVLVPGCTGCNLSTNASRQPGPAVVSSLYGVSATFPNAFARLADGAIVKLSPSIGQLGTRVTINGSSLTGYGQRVASVRFGNISATILSNSNDSSLIQVQVGAFDVPRNTSVTVTLESSSGAVVTSTPVVWTYLVPGSIQTISPMEGQLGTIVTINGTNLLGYGNNITGVQLGSANVSIISSNNTAVVVQVTGGSVGNGSVVLTADTGAMVTSSEMLWNLQPAGMVDLINPSEGQSGTIVTINGSSLTGYGQRVVSVRFGNISATILSNSNGSSLIQVQVGAFNVPRNTNVTVTLESSSGAVVTSTPVVWTYLVPGSIQTISPMEGQLGTIVTINGTNLLGYGNNITGVQLGSANVSIISSNNTAVIVQVTGGSVGNGSVVLTADTGAMVTSSELLWNLRPAGMVDLINPARGQSGTIVTISGTSLTGYGQRVATVKFGNIFATILSNSNDSSRIQVQVGAFDVPGNTSVTVTLQSSSGAVVTSTPVVWTYLVPGSIQTISPMEGQLGTIVTINGTNLLGYGNTITGVQLGSANVSIISSNNTAVVVQVTGGSVGNGSVVLTADTGAMVTSSEVLWNLQPAGMVDLINPSEGQSGTIVTINGSSLTGYGQRVVSVRFGNISATILSNSNDSSLIQVQVGAFNVPRNTSVTVTLQSSSGAVVTSTPVVWTYLVPGSIQTISPMEGQLGTIVTINGTNLLGYGNNITGVQLGSANVSIISSNNTAVVVQVTGGSVGNGSVVLTADTGAMVTSSEVLWNLRPAGMVDLINPTRGQSGTIVIINGTSLTGYGQRVASVRFGNISATILSNSNDSSLIQVQVGAFDVLGNTSVTVTLESSSGAVVTSTPVVWTYLVPGSIQTISPMEGQLGTIVTINGTNLLGYGNTITGVQLGSANVSIISSNNTAVVVQVTGGSVGNGSVVLTADTGAMVTSSALLWNLQPAGMIDSIDPLQGLYGTTVLITGTDLTAYSDSIVSVSFGNSSARIISNNSDPSTVEVEVGNINVTTETPLIIRLTTSFGATISSSIAWTYLVAGNIQSIQPPTGQNGTFVTIRGTDLLGNGTNITSVQLGNASVLVLSSNNTYIRGRIVGGAVGQGPVLLISDTGARLSSPQTWELLPSGNISSISPQSGQFGVFFRVEGSNLVTPGNMLQSLTVAGIPVFSVFVARNGSLITGRLGAIATSVSNVEVVITSNTGAVVTAMRPFQYVVSSPIQLVYPNQGGEGTLLIVTGHDLFGVGVSSVASVRLSQYTQSLTVVSAQRSAIVVRAGPENTSVSTALNLTIESNTGALFFLADAFQYNSSGVASVSPSAGQSGTVVWIQTTRPLQGDETVQLAGTPATILQRTSNRIRVSAGRPLQSGIFTGDVVLTSNSGLTVRQQNGFTYQNEAVLFSIAPSIGQRGTRVSITGRNLLVSGTNVSQLLVGGATVSVTSFSNSSISGRLGSAPNGSDIQLRLDTGAAATLINGWQSQVGSITSFQPMQGQTGTIVTIVGSYLVDGGNLTRVSLNGLDADILNFSATTITVRARSNASLVGSGPIAVEAATGALLQSSANWTFTPLATISRLSRMSGQRGTQVTIFGMNLLAGGQRIDSVLLGGESAEILISNSTAITVSTPSPGNTTNVSTPLSVRVTSDTGGFAEVRNNWTYLSPGKLLLVIPGQGQTGTRVRITGENLSLAGGTIASVFAENGNTNTSLGIVNSSMNAAIVRMNCSRPGTWTLRVVTTTGAWFSGVSFDCLTPGSIASLQPTIGLGNTRIQVDGINLLGYGQRLAKMTLNGVDVNLTGITAFQYTNTSISFRAPVDSLILPSGPTVLIESDTGSLVSSDSNPAIQWTYANDTEIFDVVPHIAKPGDIVTIRGQWLMANASGVFSVVVGDAAVLSVLNYSDTEITVQLGASNLSSPISIILANGGVFSDENVNFTIDAQSAAGQCQLLLIQPPAGQNGTSVLISGQGLTTATSTRVWLSGQEATFHESNSTHITVRAQSPGLAMSLLSTYSPGDVQVLLTNNTRNTVCKLRSAWLFYPQSAVNINLRTGREGTEVVITSAVLFQSLARRSIQPQTVRLAGTPQNISRFEVSNQSISWSTIPERSHQIIFRAQPSLRRSATGNVQVTFSDGSSLVAGQWTYNDGNITSIFPSSGSNGVVVRLTGSYLIGGGGIRSITLAGIPAIVLQRNETSIQVRVNANAANASGQTGPIRIISTTGAQLTSQQNWTLTRLAIDLVAPSSGQVGTRVTLTGLFGSPQLIASVTIGGVNTTILPNASATMVQVALADGNPSNQTAGVIIYFTDQSSITSLQTFTFLQAGNITDVVPARPALGTRVRIAGENLLGGGQYASEVCLDGVAAQQVTLSTNNLIQVIAGISGSDASLQQCNKSKVLVRANTGAEITMNSVNLISYIQLLTLTVSPAQGQNGTLINISFSGSLNDSVEYVSFAGIRASILFVSANMIQVALASSPFHNPVTGIVEVGTFSAVQPGLGGQVLQGNTVFTYQPTGQIASVLPATGQRGTYVNITGRMLFGYGSSVSRAMLGNQDCEVLPGATSSSLRIRVPVGNDSTIPQVGVSDIVLIANTGAVVQLSDGFTYLQPGSITDISPASGRWGTKVTLSGQRLLGGALSVTMITIGNVTVTSFQTNTNSAVVFDLPSTAFSDSPQNVSAVLESDTGAVSDTSFLLLPLGEVNSVSPANGTFNTTLCLNGGGLLGGGTHIVNASIGNISAVVLNNTDSQVCLQAGRNHQGNAILAATIILRANTGAITVARNAWMYDRTCGDQEYQVSSVPINCSSCSAECNGCTGPTNRDCNVCSPSSFILSNGSGMACVKQCDFVSDGRRCVSACDPLTQYAFLNVTANSSQCLSCSSECLGCTGSSATECRECRVANVSGTCMPSCLSSQYLDGKQCRSCDPLCTNCTGPSRYECTVCSPTGFEVVNTTYFQLQPNISVVVNSITCIANCEANFYNNSHRQCRKCHAQCELGCTGPLPTDCGQCANFALGNGQCVAACPSRAYFTVSTRGNEVCTPCAVHCAECTSDSNDLGDGCTECTSTSLRQENISGSGNTTICIGTRCEEGYYEDTTQRLCRRCPPSCANGCEEKSPACKQSDVFKCEIGTIGIAAGVGLILLVIIFVLVLLRCRQQRKEYSVSNVDSEQITLRETRFSPDGNTMSSMPSEVGMSKSNSLRPLVHSESTVSTATRYQPEPRPKPQPLVIANTEPAIDEPQEEYLDMGQTEGHDAPTEEMYEMMDSSMQMAQANVAAKPAGRPPSVIQHEDIVPDGEMYEDMAQATTTAKARGLSSPPAPSYEPEAAEEPQEVYEDMGSVPLPPQQRVEQVAQPASMATRGVRSKSQAQLEENVLPLPARSGRPISTVSTSSFNSPPAAAPMPNHQPARGNNPLPLPARDENPVALPPRDRGHTSGARDRPPAAKITAMSRQGSTTLPSQRSLPSVPSADPVPLPPRNVNHRPPPPSNPPPPISPPASSAQPMLPPRNPGMARSVQPDDEGGDGDIYEIAQDEDEILYEATT